MWTYPETFDVIVIGGGHAGCEAAHAAARMGVSVLLLTMNLDTIGKMSCNPSIGGTAKGHIVREIDALGGIMGKIADRTAIQFRMLNASKGPAVWSPRAQSDKNAYQLDMKFFLEKTPHLTIKQGTIISINVEKKIFRQVTTQEGITYKAKTLILSAGTFMRGLLHIGTANHPGGRFGDKSSNQLSLSLENLGFKLQRFKTGTPPRLHLASIDLSKTEEQPSEEGVAFSFDQQEKKLPQISCYITYTNEKTQKIIENNLHLSPLYSGIIQGVGPRYCPSIEHKFVRFKDKKRHQIFLEPEGLNTQEVYVNGLSSSLPFNIQYEMIQTIPGLEKSQIMRPAYAVEYDCVTSGQMTNTLETKGIENLFFSGQINGTTGYEEAAAQGLIAGINAALKCKNRSPFILNRSESYIGVMIDDLITKELDEPYRMFTSRAEHRLLLRQDNADLRLRAYGYALGLIDERQFKQLKQKEKKIQEGISYLTKTHLSHNKKSMTFAKLLKQPQYSYQKLLEKYPQLIDQGEEINRAIEIDLKYAGYIIRQKKIIEKQKTLETFLIPKFFNYDAVVGLRNEALEKLKKKCPYTLGQAARISGVSPADISILMVFLKK